MAPFRFITFRKGAFRTLYPMQKTLLSHISLGDLKTPTSKHEIFLQLSIQRDKSKIGTWHQESVSAQWRMKLLILMHNSIVLTLTMRAPKYLLLEVSLCWGCMMRWKGKRNFNWKSQTLLIIVIQIESFVRSLTKIPNFNILCIVVVGTRPLLLGTLELGNQFKMFTGHLLEVTGFQIAEWIFWRLHGGRMISFSSGNQESVSLMRL